MVKTGRKAKRVLRDTPCECADGGCPVGHRGRSTCAASTRGGLTLFRVDMEDRTGTRMCAACADDAMSSGLFRGGRG
jgi:hypothetical protein